MDFDVDRALAEAMGFGAFMDVDELRLLYYGRMDVFVSFSDDDEMRLNGYNDGELIRPFAIESHTIQNVVAKKASTHLLYGHVFRFKTTRSGFLSDIKLYNMDNFKEDMEIIYLLDYLEDDDIDAAKDYVIRSGRFRTYFEKIWEITKQLSAKKSKRYGDKVWRKIFADLGYSGFTDPSGKGILIDSRDPVTLVLDVKKREDLDIVPVQKYREDKRKMLVDRINRKVRYMRVRRNKVAKRHTPQFRRRGNSFTDGPVKSFFGEIL